MKLGILNTAVISFIYFCCCGIQTATHAAPFSFLNPFTYLSPNGLSTSTQTNVPELFEKLDEIKTEIANLSDEEFTNRKTEFLQKLVFDLRSAPNQNFPDIPSELQTLFHKKLDSLDRQTALNQIIQLKSTIQFSAESTQPYFSAEFWENLIGCFVTLFAFGGVATISALTAIIGIPLQILVYAYCFGIFSLTVTTAIPISIAIGATFTPFYLAYEGGMIAWNVARSPYDRYIEKQRQIVQESKFAELIRLVEPEKEPEPSGDLKLECFSCWNPRPEGANTSGPANCKCWICKDCEPQHLTYLLSTPTHLRCGGCRKELRFEDIKNLKLTPEQRAILRRRQLYWKLTALPGWKFCSGRNCFNGKQVQRSNPHFACDVCGKKGCLICGQSHEGACS